jgi:hypothetical protein
MKLSENTINVLKNFATINPSLLVKPGNALTTISPQKSIFAKATVEESFPRQFAIYELSKFLGVLSLFKEPDLDFGDKQLTIVAGRQSVSYTYADPDMIVSPPSKDITFPSADIEFDISQEELQRVVRATAVLQLPDIAVVGNGQKVQVTATNAKNPTTDVFSIDVGESDKTFNVIFKADNIIKLLSGNYNVKISMKGLSQFTSDNITYFVATEVSSNY